MNKSFEQKGKKIILNFWLSQKISCSQIFTLNMVGILWSRVSDSKDHVKFCRTCVIIFKIRIIAYLETWSYMIQALLIFSFLDEDCRSKRMWRADLFWVDSSAGFGLWGSTGLLLKYENWNVRTLIIWFIYPQSNWILCEIHLLQFPKLDLACF